MNDQQLPAPMMMNPHPPPQMMNPLPPQMMNQTHPIMLNRYNNNMTWQDPNMKFPLYPSKPRSKPNNWKGKNVTEYKPPSLNDLQSQNRMKARKYYHPKKKFNNNNNNGNNRYMPYAPRNTTSFIIRAKKSGGIASLVSPCPVTPAVLPTPIFSPSREVLGDMAKEEWGVDGYGSMKGLIRLRPQNDDEDEENDSGESDVEEHVEVERRLDHDLSRFEMIYPGYSDYAANNNVLENRVDDQDMHIAHLEEENLTLKERLFLMEREVADLRRRLGFLEGREINSSMAHEEVVENESDGGSDVRMEENLGCEVAVNSEIAVDGGVKDVVIAKEDNELGNEILEEKVVSKVEVFKNDELNVSSCDDAERGCRLFTNNGISVSDEVNDTVIMNKGTVNVEELRNLSVEEKVVLKVETLKNDGGDHSVMDRIMEDELDKKNDETDH